MKNNDKHNFKCPLCFYKCVLYSELINHYITNHKNDPEFKFRCNYCQRIFTKADSFNKHLQRKPACRGLINNDDTINPTYQEPANQLTSEVVNQDCNEGKIILIIFWIFLNVLHQSSPNNSNFKKLSESSSPKILVKNSLILPRTQKTS